ncbi:DNA/RNA non-specific endonuclease [Thermodesulfobacteriota bacterium]
MKKLFLLISILLTITATTIPLYAGCRGCCSHHGGVVCINGVTKCRDGSPLSQKCATKGCNKCGDVSSTPTTVSKPQDPAVFPDNSKPKESPTVSPGFYHCNGHVAYGIPGPDDQLLCREGYTVGYDYDRKVPTWVAYRLTPDSVNKKFERSNKFKEDTDIPPQYRSTLSDYKGSGYDRGHMAASATIDSSYNAMMESFLLSNMTPQLPGLNRQGWRYLEQYVREWTNERGELYVVTGTMFIGEHTVIGNGVHVPTHFYKIVFDPAGMDAIAFLVPHRPISKYKLPGYIVSVDEVEQLTGLDFNNLLDDTVEDDIEDDIEEMW